MPSLISDIDLPLPPIMFAEIVLCFDCDFSMDAISDILGLRASETKRRAENPN